MLFNQFIILLEQELIIRCHAKLMYTIINKHNIGQDDIQSFTLYLLDIEKGNTEIVSIIDI